MLCRPRFCQVSGRERSPEIISVTLRRENDADLTVGGGTGKKSQQRVQWVRRIIGLWLRSYTHFHVLLMQNKLLRCTALQYIPGSRAELTRCAYITTLYTDRLSINIYIGPTFTPNIERFYFQSGIRREKARRHPQMSWVIQVVPRKLICSLTYM